MDIKQAYDLWANQYDHEPNKTRDLEAIALRTVLKDLHFENCLEIGCGTGKNTKWLSKISSEVLCVDLSEEMINKAKEKNHSEKITFKIADINQPWNFATKSFDLIVFSLVLEHIENLEPVFRKAAFSLNNGGIVYVGELHPFKQYSGTKARFSSNDKLKIVTCYNHHVSDFTLAAENSDMRIIKLHEFFDDNDSNSLPRILSILFRKA
jgi:predicted TPR repeat methyltransferase